MIYVMVQNNNLDYALSEFRRQVRATGILKELREREFYRKPGDKKRYKRKKAAIQRLIDRKKRK